MLVVAAHQLDAFTLQTTLAAERPRLVAVCAHVSGSWDTAEDLAQETLLEAWRARDRLHNPDGLARWLTTIARNVCLRWRRSKGREAAYLAFGEVFSDALEIWSAENSDGVIEGAGRPELSAVLQNALTTLPAVTRAAVVGSYVDETPQATTPANLITVLNIQGFGYVTAGLLAILLLPIRRPARAPAVAVSTETTPERPYI